MGSEFLFARPSVLSGIARSLDLWGTFDSYNESPNEAIADARALHADWRSVGESLANSIAAAPNIEIVETPEQPDAASVDVSEPMGELVEKE